MKSYSSEILHGSCFKEVQYGTVTKWRWNRRSHRKPPYSAELFLPFLAIFKYKERQESGRLLMQEKKVWFY